MSTLDSSIQFRICPELGDKVLGALFKAGWKGYRSREWGAVLERSLVYICAYQHTDLIGFVNVAWDGGLHAFLLDIVVHPRFRRAKVGTRLVHEAIKVAASAGIVWLHVDYEPALRPFYVACGFTTSEAGILQLNEEN